MCGLRKPLALSMATAATSGAKYGLQGETLVSAVYIGWVPFCVSGAQSAYLGVLEGPNQHIWFCATTVYCDLERIINILYIYIYIKYETVN
jgi:hypothetical protein